MRTDAANETIVRLIRQRHPNSAVMVQALEIATDRNLEIASDDLSPLCQYNRGNVREAARKLAERLGHPTPADFDPALAMEDEAIEDMMARLATLYRDLLPSDVPFVGLEVGPDYSRFLDDPIVRGWLLEETDTAYTIMTLACTTMTITRESMGDPTATPIPIAMADEVERVAELRASGDPESHLSAMGRLPNRSEGRRAASLYEITLAHLLYSQQEYELAARVLLPALEMLYCDEHLIDLAKDKLGWIWGCRMLVAFVGQRDYDKALRYAGLLVEHFDGTQFSGLARELQIELPKRRDDFQALTLPTYEEWNQLRAPLTREQQIQFLCERLRLLNCFPSDVQGYTGMADRQFRELCGLDEGATMGLDLGETEVINPYSLLTDSWGRQDRPADAQPLILTMADIPILATHLADDWHILAVSQWQLFHPGRALERQRPFLVGLINHLAVQDICNSADDDWSTEAGRQAAVERIIAWAEEWQDADRADLLLEAVERALTEQEPWPTAGSQADELCQLGDRRVIPLLRRFLERDDVDSRHLGSILRACRRIDAAAFLDDVRAMLSSDDLDVRIQAGLIYLEAGELATAQETLGEALSRADRNNVSGEVILMAVRALLAEGSAESRQVIAGFLARDELTLFSDEAYAVLRETMAAGMVGPYRCLRRMLLNRTNRSGSSAHIMDTWTARNMAHNIIGWVARDPAVRLIITETEGDRERRTRLLLEWLDGKINAIESAESDADADAR